MKIDLLFVQFAIIFLPGLIWAGLDSRYALKSKPSEFQYVLRAFLFGMASYGVTFGIYAMLRWPFRLSDFSAAATNGILGLQGIEWVVLRGHSGGSCCGEGLS